MEPAPDGFGCPACRPADPGAAWEARSRLAFVSELADESHFIVSLKACAGCSQRYVSVFTERIDWSGGDDPQEWSLYPLTEPEALSLAVLRDAALEKALLGLDGGRRWLWRDHPKGASESRFAWRTGGIVGLHD